MSLFSPIIALVHLVPRDFPGYAPARGSFLANPRAMPHRPAQLVLLTAALALFAGCGINKSRLATEQLVVSEAVDQAVAAVDFSPLSGRRVYFDTQYLDGVTMGPT